MKIKFNLGWILSVAAAVVVAAMGFMSFYYLEGGNLVLPIIVAICLLVLPIVVNMYLIPAKECSKPFYFHKEAIKEATMLVAAILLFIISMLLVNHFFTVNNRTDKIATIVADQRRQLEDMQASYVKHIKGRENNYKAYLNEVLHNKERDLITYNRVFPNGSNDIELLVRRLHNDLSLEGLRESVSAVYDTESISWWQLPAVMNKVGEISTALENNYNLMTQRDHNVTADNIAQDDYWTYSYTSVRDMMANFTSSDGFITSIWTVISVLIAYFFIMLPYISADRDSRSKGVFAELLKSEDKEYNHAQFNEGIGKL